MSARPFRVRLISEGPTANPILERNTRAALLRGLPEVSCQRPMHAKRLAVVGGGPSVAARLEELRAFDGDVWGINATADWLIRQGVNARFFTVDGAPDIGAMVGCAKSGIVASSCDPSVFDALEYAEIFFIDKQYGRIAIYGGATTACRAPLLALRMGYADVSFYGCEGSFDASTHAYRHEDRDDVVIVEAGGQTFKTAPDFILQTESLAATIRDFPQFFHDRSGGLLGAMVAHPDGWRWAAVSAPYKHRLEKTNGRTLFPTAYVGAA